MRLVFLLPSVCAIKPSNFSDEKHAVWSGYHLYTIALSFTGGMEKEEACKSSLTMKPRHKTEGTRLRAPTDLAFRRRTWSPRQLLRPTVANSYYDITPHLLPSQPLLYWFFFLLPPRRIRVRFCLRIPRKIQLNKKHVIGWRRALRTPVTTIPKASSLRYTSLLPPFMDARLET